MIYTMIEDRGILEDTISLCHMRLIIEDSPPASLQPSPFIGIILVKLKKIGLASHTGPFLKWTMDVKRRALSKQEKYSR